METRALGEDIKSPSYFNKDSSAPSSQENLVTGSRDMTPQLPYVISGGTNTERYYFIHINAVTDYKFNIRPEYFGDETNYTSVFPKRIEKILKNDADALIYCVFDWDTIYNHKTNQTKHLSFENLIKQYIDAGKVVLCPSMPCVEFWFLLHFLDYNDLIKTCSKKLQSLLSPYMLPYFPGARHKLLRLLKKECYVKDVRWVKELCADGKLEEAIKRAKNTIEQAEIKGDLQEYSYSYIYRIFER